MIDVAVKYDNIPLDILIQFQSILGWLSTLITEDSANVIPFAKPRTGLES